jgi:hypothetical protein
MTLRRSPRSTVRRTVFGCTSPPRRAWSSRTVVQPLALGDLERRAQALVVGAEAHEAADERLVGAVSLAGARERAVQLERARSGVPPTRPAGEQAQRHGAGGVRRARPDHHGADDVEQRDHAAGLLELESGEERAQVVAGVTRLDASRPPRRALRDDGAAARAALGPRSTTQSAVLITSSECSMTSTVLPRSTRRCSTSSRQAHVLEVQPVVGSSRM